MLIVFETHGETQDNKDGVASGWQNPPLTRRGRNHAREIGKRHDNQELDAVFVPDVRRAIRTAEIAFVGITPRHLFHDQRLRECDYGDYTGHPKGYINDQKLSRITRPFPNGESYNQVMDRMGSFLDELVKKELEKVVIIGGHAVHYGLDLHLRGIPLKESITAGYEPQPGWEFEV